MDRDDLLRARARERALELEHSKNIHTQKERGSIVLGSNAFELLVAAVRKNVAQRIGLMEGDASCEKMRSVFQCS